MSRPRRTKPALLAALAAGLTALSLGLAVEAGAVGRTAPPCSQGCDVHVGTYKGHNDQGKEVLLHVSVGHLMSGPHIVATVHIIDHFKTEYVVSCGNTRANSHVNLGHPYRGHIIGVQGHWRHGETTMHVLWAPHEVPVGDVRTTARGCHGISHFRVHRTGP
jgi:hypothetical protein